VPPGSAVGQGARWGFVVLERGRFLDDEVHRLPREAFGRDTGNRVIECGFRLGGPAKRPP
jgi:1-aminocyclopropane-1-carboxylate deaminase